MPPAIKRGAAKSASNPPKRRASGRGGAGNATVSPNPAASPGFKEITGVNAEYAVKLDAALAKMTAHEVFSEIQQRAVGTSRVEPRPSQGGTGQT
eukprot:12135864-Karenia_brevis.AAC.1